MCTTFYDSHRIEIFTVTLVSVSKQTTMTTMEDTELDAAPVDSRFTDARSPGHPGFINRISNQELYERHPSYPRTVDEDPVEPVDLIHIVFVRAKEDYDTFDGFLKWFTDILLTVENCKTVKYETHDSELFPGTHDDNIHDICERAILIVPFLSKFFCTDKALRFFTSEAIGKTRLDQTFPKGALEKKIKQQKKYAVRPIHTADPRSGTYRIPTGLTMMKGIEYYSKDKHVGYVKNQVTGMIKEAIRKFDERKAAMVSALTGVDQFLESFEESFEKKFGPPPVEPSIESIMHGNPNGLAFVGNGYGVQEQQVGNMGMGEYLTLTTDSLAAETDGNTSLTNSASSDTQGNKQLNDATVLTNGQTTLPQTSTTSEDERVNLLAEGKNVCINDSNGFRPAMCQNDTSLEIDNGSLHKNTEQNATQKATKSQDQNSPDRALNFSPGVRVRKDSEETVRTNYISYTGPAVPNVAKAAASNTTQKELKGKQPMKNTRKKGENIIFIQNCGVVQIGDGSAIETTEKRKSAQKKTAKSETSWYDTSPTTQISESETSWNDLSSTDESYIETRTKVMTNEDTVSKEFNTSDSDNENALFADNIPSDFSHASRNSARSSQGLKMAEEHGEELEEPGSDMDSFLDERLNDPSLESLKPFEEDPLECTHVCHDPVVRLCKNTMKRYGSVDSGYHSHFSHIYQTSLTRRPGTEQDDDEVD